MKKIGGYLIMIIGLALMTAKAIPPIAEQVPYLNDLNKYIVLAGTLVLLTLGGILAFSSSSDKKQEREVPIYEGEGKKRKVVGYRRHK